jgi:hypothetical protein
MRKLRTFLLAGLLSWPALSLAQDLLPPPPPPLEIPALPPRTTDKPTTTPTLGTPPNTSSLPPLPTNAALPPVNSLPPIGPVTTPPDLTAPLPPSPTTRDVLADLEKPKPVPMPPLKPDMGMKPYKPMMPPRDPRVPDLSGMPGMDMCPPMSCLPPMTAAPIPPPPCCPPEMPPECGPCGGCYFFAEGLYFRPRRGDQLAERRFVDGSGNQITEGVFWTPNSEIGYRGGVGFRTGDGMTVWTKYTWFEQDIYRENVVLDAAAPVGSVITTTIFGIIPDNVAGALPGTGFQFTHYFRYHTIEGMGGAAFAPAEYVDLIIAGGVKLVKIDQNYGFLQVNTNPQPTTVVDISLDVEGFGPRFGGECRVYLCRNCGCDASLFTRGYVSGLWIRREEQHFIQSFTNGSVSAVQVRTLNREDFMPVMELAGGVELELGGCVTISGGYEWNYYWDLGSVTDFFGNTYRQDITLEGAFLRVGILF